MLRLATLFWLLLVSAAAAGMYAVKYRVQGIEHALLKTERATIAEQREIRVLDAEWTYLNRPESLAQMNAQFLSLVPITTQELRTSVNDVPMRPAPGAAPSGALVTVAATAAPSPLRPRIIPAVLKEGPAERAALREKLTGRTMPEPRRDGRPAPGGYPSAYRIKTAARPAPQSQRPRRGRSLDDLIARIVASR
jgi:hypothetical protein